MDGLKIPKNKFSNIKNIYLLMIKFQNESLKLGVPTVHDDITPWKTLTNDAMGRINEILSIESKDKND